MTRFSRKTFVATLAALLLLPAGAHATSGTPAFTGQTSGDTQVTVGRTVHMQATVTNVGSAAEAADVKIVVIPTNGAKILGASCSDGGTATYRPDSPRPGTETCVFTGGVPVGESRTLNLDLTASVPVSGEPKIGFVARLSHRTGPGPNDWAWHMHPQYPSENSFEHGLYQMMDVRIPAGALTVTAPTAILRAGEEADLTYTLTHSGGEDGYGALEMGTALPSERVTVLSAAVDGHDCPSRFVDAPNIVSCVLPEGWLRLGETRTLTVHVKAASDTGGSVIAGTAGTGTWLNNSSMNLYPGAQGFGSLTILPAQPEPPTDPQPVTPDPPTDPQPQPPVTSDPPTDPQPQPPVTPQPPTETPGPVKVQPDTSKTLTADKRGTVPVTVSCPALHGCAAQSLPFTGKVGKIKIAGKLSVPMLRSGQSVTAKIALGKKTVAALLKAGKRKVTLTIQTATGPVKITVTLKQAKKAARS